MLALVCVAVLAALVGSVAAGPNGPNLIVNGGFESGMLSPFVTSTPKQVLVTTALDIGYCTFKPEEGNYFVALNGTSRNPASLVQVVPNLDDGRSYGFSFFLTTSTVSTCIVNYGFLGYNVVTVTLKNVSSFGCSWPPLGYSFELISPPGQSTANFSASFSCFTNNNKSAIALDALTLIEGAAIVGDPVFTGFHGQSFRVKGLPHRVFNIMSTPQLQFNSRFVPLNEGDAMNSAQMKTARMMREVKLGGVDATSSYFVPRTTAWNHNGTYMGECGVKLNGARLRIVPGPYLKGFATVELNGEPIFPSTEQIGLSDGFAIKRMSHRVDIVTPLIRFALVNSDKFVNVESAMVMVPYTPELHIDGLLGQTADAEWTVQKTTEWRQHLEEDNLLAGDDVFGNDFVQNQYTAA